MKLVHNHGRKKTLIFASIVNLFFVVTLLLHAPVESYIGGASDFWFTFSDLLPAIIVTALGTFVALEILDFLLPVQLTKFLSGLLFAFGFCSYIQVNFLNPDYAAVDLVQFAFEHAHPGDLFIQKADAATIGDLAKAVQQLFGDSGTNIIGTRHGEKLYETLMTREERLRSEDMGNYYRVAPDGRDLNYDKFFIKGEVRTESEEAYTSHNTKRLDVEGTVAKLLTTEYVRNALNGIFEAR